MLSPQIFCNLTVGTCIHDTATQLAPFLWTDRILKPFAAVLFLSKEVKNIWFSGDLVKQKEQGFQRHCTNDQEHNHVWLGSASPSIQAANRICTGCMLLLMHFYGCVSLYEFNRMYPLKIGSVSHICRDLPVQSWRQRPKTGKRTSVQHWTHCRYRTKKQSLYLWTHDFA